MVKKLSIKKPKLLAHQYIDITIQVCANVLIIAFLICIIVYIFEINKYSAVKYKSDGSTLSKPEPVQNIKKSMQRFINVMAWIMIITIGLSAFISIV